MYLVGKVLLDDGTTARYGGKLTPIPRAGSVSNSVGGVVGRLADCDLRASLPVYRSDV
jgi:hypothetical protein